MGEKAAGGGVLMAVVASECEGRRVTYTGVNEDGEIRDCARCMEPVEINPDEETVTHL